MISLKDSLIRLSFSSTIPSRLRSNSGPARSRMLSHSSESAIFQEPTNHEVERDCTGRVTICRWEVQAGDFDMRDSCASDHLTEIIIGPNGAG